MKQEEVASQRRLDAEMEAARVTALKQLEVWAPCKPFRLPQHLSHHIAHVSMAHHRCVL